MSPNTIIVEQIVLLSMVAINIKPFTTKELRNNGIKFQSERITTS